MSPVRHHVSGAALAFVLTDELEKLRAELETAPARSARTLVKDGPLRVTLVGVKPGGELRPHQADGPITLQVLEGELDFQVEEQIARLSEGTLFALEGGIMHGVRSEHGAVFLLTVMAVRDPSHERQPASNE